MSEHTLFLVQSEFAKTNPCLDQLCQMATLQDTIILMGDSVLFAQDTRLEKYSFVYMLETEIELITSILPKRINVLSYATFADLVLDFKRCICLK